MSTMTCRINLLLPECDLGIARLAAHRAEQRELRIQDEMKPRWYRKAWTREKAVQGLKREPLSAMSWFWLEEPGHWELILIRLRRAAQLAESLGVTTIELDKDEVFALSTTTSQGVRNANRTD